MEVSEWLHEELLKIRTSFESFLPALHNEQSSNEDLDIRDLEAAVDLLHQIKRRWIEERLSHRANLLNGFFRILLNEQLSYKDLNETDRSELERLSSLLNPEDIASQTDDGSKRDTMDGKNEHELPEGLRKSLAYYLDCKFRRL